jgi:hypothetical protein
LAPLLTLINGIDFNKKPDNEIDNKIGYPIKVAPPKSAQVKKIKKGGPKI